MIAHLRLGAPERAHVRQAGPNRSWVKHPKGAMRLAQTDSLGWGEAATLMKFYGEPGIRS